jgi:hypothetical protein
MKVGLFVWECLPASPGYTCGRAHCGDHALLNLTELTRNCQAGLCSFNAVECIREVVGSNLGRNTCYPGLRFSLMFLNSTASQANIENVPRLNHDFLLSSNSQFINNHSALYILDQVHTNLLNIGVTCDDFEKLSCKKCRHIGVNIHVHALHVADSYI